MRDRIQPTPQARAAEEGVIVPGQMRDRPACASLRRFGDGCIAVATVDQPSRHLAVNRAARLDRGRRIAAIGGISGMGADIAQPVEVERDIAIGRDQAVFVA